MKILFFFLLVSIEALNWHRMGQDPNAHRIFQSHSPEEQYAPCTKEAVVTHTIPYNPAIGSFYETDGVQGMTGQAFVRYRILNDGSGRIRVCDIGVRLPAIERVNHCIPPEMLPPGHPTPFCPPGASIHVDIPYPASATNKQHFKFLSVGFGINKQGHANGNYEEYRHLHSPPTPDKQPTWSWDIPHLDAHFFFKDAAYASAIQGWVPGESNPPAEIQQACDCEPSPKLAASVGHYSEKDCIPSMGRHWSEDKLETRQTFASQPALIYGTYACESFFWEPMVAENTTNWVRDNAPNKRATISWPQPERYSWSGWYPTHYFMQEADEAHQIGGKRTVEVGFTRFRFRQRLFDRFVRLSRRSGAVQTSSRSGTQSTPIQHEVWFTPVIAVVSALVASLLTLLIVLLIVKHRNESGAYQRFQ